MGNVREGFPGKGRESAVAGGWSRNGPEIVAGLSVFVDYFEVYLA